MIASVSVLDDGTDPNSIKSHTLDVVEIIFKSDIASPAIPA